MVYDIRYNLTSAVYKHHMGFPVLALATSCPRDMRPTTLVSTGGPIFEMSQINLESGVVECLYRCNDNSKTESIKRSDLVTIPEFHKETTFRDSYLSTMRRESCFRQFNRSMMAVRSHESFINLMNQATYTIKNIDT